MNGEDMEIRTRLLSALRERKAILFAGAGCSKISGYPLWPELIEDMHKKYIPSLTLSPNIDYGVRADQIKDQMARMGLEREYFAHLERTFEPGQGKNHTPFHCTLVKLGFSGIVTTNYDILLECSVDEAFASKDTFPRCDQIDLCIQKQYTYRVFKFLRNLSTSNKHSEILHIHGIYNNPYGIILTRNDYLKAYGELSNDGMDVKQQQPLDTIHRKVIWSLLAMHPILFVGFSMSDEFFMKMLEIVQEDFNLGQDRVHYAIMGYQNETERDMIFENLKSKGISTIFYQIMNRESSNDQDHGGLMRLVFELADELNIQVGSPNLRTLNEKMLER